MDAAENITFLPEVIKRQTEEDVQYANIQYHIVTTTTTHSQNKQGAAYNQSHQLLPNVAAISELAQLAVQLVVQRGRVDVDTDISVIQNRHKDVKTVISFQSYDHFS